MLVEDNPNPSIMETTILVVAVVVPVLSVMMVTLVEILPSGNGGPGVQVDIDGNNYYLGW